MYTVLWTEYETETRRDYLKVEYETETRRDYLKVEYVDRV